MKVEYTSAVPVAFNFVTNTSETLVAAPVRPNAPAVVGKSGDCVVPTMYVLPLASTAMPAPVSWLEPPRNVEYATPGSMIRSRSRL